MPVAFSGVIGESGNFVTAADRRKLARRDRGAVDLETLACRIVFNKPTVLERNRLTLEFLRK
jgi:hypothetical protein